MRKSEQVGAIVMKGNIQKRGKNSYRIRIHLGYDAKGKRHYYTETVHGRKKDAEARLAELLVEYNHDQLVQPDQVTVAQYMDKWLQTYAKLKVRETTYARYESLIRVHVKPNFGERRLRDLRAEEIQTLYRELQSRLSNHSIRRLHYVLHEALKYAERWKYVSQNIMKQVEPPPEPDTEMVIWTEEEVRRFLEVSQTNRHYALFHLLLHTGLRVGEALALKWQNTDLDNRTLLITHTLRQAGRKPKLGPTKRKNSKRLIPIVKPVVQVLQQHRIKQMEHRLALGSEYRDMGFVFASEVGTPLNISNIHRRHWRPLVQKAKVPYICIHNLRHTAVSLLIRAGVDITTISNILGHSNPTVTLNIYSHLLPGAKEDAMERLARLIDAPGDHLVTKTTNNP